MFHHTGGKPCKCFLSLISPKSSDYIVKCVTNIIPMPLAWTFKNSATVGWSHFYQKIVTTVKHCSPKRMPRRVTCSITLGESLVIAFFVQRATTSALMCSSTVLYFCVIFVFGKQSEGPHVFLPFEQSISNGICVTFNCSKRRLKCHTASRDAWQNKTWYHL